jgi:hypothetical protein
MNFKALLEKYKNDKTRCLINSLGDGETRGLIIEVHDDYIDYELLDAKKLKGSDKEKQIREVKHIQISEGEKETEAQATNGLAKFT